MRAMVLHRTAPAHASSLAPEELPAPRPDAGELLIEVEACGVCRTDLHIIEGDVAAPLPRVPGHQVTGRVIGVGDGVDGFARGDTAGVGWLHRTCGTCAYCASGRENLCMTALFTGRDVDGGYAEVMVADARFAYHLPAGFTSLDAAPLLCAGIIGYRSLKLSEIRPGGRLALVGFGASAHLAIQVALHWRCDVYVFTREERHRVLALGMGAAWAGAATDDPGVPLDAAVIFAPSGELVPQILRRLAPGGTLAINAIHTSPIPSFEYAGLYGERTLRSVTNYTREDAREFLELAASIPVRTQVERFPLADANEALLRIKHGEVRGAAVLEVARE